MDWAPLAAVWELPPLYGEELGAELGSLEEIGAAFIEPSLTTSSLGSWADEWERVDATLAVAETQMGRGCTDDSPGEATATAEAQLEEEDWEWLAALGAATALDQPPGKQEAPRPMQGPPPAKGAQRSTGKARGRGWWPPELGGPPSKGPPPEGSPAAPAARGGKRRTRSRC